MHAPAFKLYYRLPLLTFTFIVTIAFCCLSPSPVHSQGNSVHPGKNPQLVILGKIETRHKTIAIFSSEEGTLYSVYGKNRSILAEHLSLKALIASFPDLGRAVSHGIAGNDARLIKLDSD